MNSEWVHNNPNNNPHNSSPIINILWTEKLQVYNKQIHHWDIFNTIQLKYESSLHNIALPSEKIISSESGEKYEQIKHRLQAKTVLKQF